jgi:thioredoxin-like negative regulator of GroEL
MIVLLLWQAALSAAWWENSETLMLNKSNFYDYIGSERHVIVEYFVPWCPQCRKMKADWDEVWRHFNGPESDRSDVVVCMVNAEDILKISKQHGVSSYPSILYYPPGSQLPSLKFTGKRSTSRLISWIETQSSSMSALEATSSDVVDTEEDGESPPNTSEQSPTFLRSQSCEDSSDTNYRLLDDLCSFVAAIFRSASELQDRVF